MRKPLAVSYLLTCRFLNDWIWSQPPTPKDLVTLWWDFLPRSFDLADGKVESSDPAAWSDWLHAVAITLHSEPRDPEWNRLDQVYSDPSADQLLDFDQTLVSAYQYFCVYWRVSKCKKADLKPYIDLLYAAVRANLEGKDNAILKLFRDVWDLGEFQIDDSAD